MKLSILGLFCLVTLAPSLALAQIATTGGGGQFETLLLNIMMFINDVVIPFIIGIGFLAFVWGMFKFFILGGADDEKKAQGRSLMIHATLGFVMIIIFFGVVNLLTSSTGLEGERLEYVPSNIVPLP